MAINFNKDFGKSDDKESVKKIDSENFDLFEDAKEYFEEGKYNSAEPLLNQMILKGEKSADVFYMLGAIYYDRGKFNKAIRAFQRSLDMDPSFTDASVGLSIILNDLGRYQEGKRVFSEAKLMLSHQKRDDEDPYIAEKLASKHDELGELYFQFHRFEEAMEQYKRSLELVADAPEVKLKIVECLVQTNNINGAINELREMISERPNNLDASIRLGELYFNSGQILEGINEWENVLRKEPQNEQAKKLLKLAEEQNQSRSQQFDSGLDSRL